MMRGSCLCGGVSFEIARAVGPFELCHCTRCRKVSGAAFAAALGVRVDDFRMLAGAELVRRYVAPVVEEPPGYSVAFCGRCGSTVPDPPPGATWFEMPAGLLDGDPDLTPDRHIFVEHRVSWLSRAEGAPALTRAELVEHRRKHGR